MPSSRKRRRSVASRSGITKRRWLSGIRRGRPYKSHLRKGKKRKRFSKYGKARKGTTPAQLNRILNYTCAPSVIPSLGRSSGFDPVKRVKHDTMATFWYTGLGVLGNTHIYDMVMNSVEDPLDSAGSIQPDGYDLLKTIYNNYVVVGATVYMRIRNSTDTYCDDNNPMFAWSVVGNNSLISTNTYTLARQQNKKFAIINSNNTTNSHGGHAYPSSKYVSSGYVRPRDFVATTDVVNFGKEGSAATGANPGRKVMCKLYAGYINDYGLGLADTMYVDVRIVQDTVYYGLKTAVRDT